jgi:ribosomal RNA-processing protein 12
MRSAVVMALSRVVFEYGEENERLHEMLPSLLKTVLVLIDEGSREVIKSVVGFIRICVARIPPKQLEPLIPELIGSLFASHQTKGRFRAKVKIILKKLLKLYGYDALMPFVPEGETRLLTHMRKLDAREKRKKNLRREQGRARVDDFEDMVNSDEDDSDDGQTFVTGATGFSRLTRLRENSSAGNTIATKRSKLTDGISVSSRSRVHMDTKIRLPDETNGEVVDMLCPSVAKRVQFANDGMADNDSDSAAMEFDDDGKLVIRDDDHVGESTELEGAIMEGSNKRLRISKLEHVHSKQIEKRRSLMAGNNKGLGSAYKAKKAGGDVKKKGQKYEPYAYVPLDGRAYSKKNRRSAIQQMASVVRKGGKRKR